MRCAHNFNFGFLLFFVTFLGSNASYGSSSCQKLQRHTAIAKRAFTQCEKKAAAKKDALDSGMHCQAEDFKYNESLKKLSHCKE